MDDEITIIEWLEETAEKMMTDTNVAGCFHTFSYMTKHGVGQVEIMVLTPELAHQAKRAIQEHIGGDPRIVIDNAEPEDQSL